MAKKKTGKKKTGKKQKKTGKKKTGKTTRKKNGRRRSTADDQAEFDWDWGDFAKYGGAALLACFGLGWIKDALSSKDVRERLKRIVAERAVTDEWRRRAHEATAGIMEHDRVGLIRALHRHTYEKLRYLADPALDGVFDSPPETTESVGGGDCKWLSVHLATLLVARGITTNFILRPGRDGEPGHALVEAGIPPAALSQIPHPRFAGVKRDAAGKPESGWILVEPQAANPFHVDAQTIECIKTDRYERVPIR